MNWAGSTVDGPWHTELQTISQPPRAHIHHRKTFRISFPGGTGELQIILTTTEQAQTDLGGVWRQGGLHSIGAPGHWVSIIGHVYSKQPLLPRDELGCAAVPASHRCYQAWHHLPRRTQDGHVQLPLASCPVGVDGKFLVLPNLNSCRKEEKLK